MSPKELAGLHGLVFQVAFGLLLAFYNREKPIRSFDIYLCYSLETSDVEVRQYSLAYWLFHAITFEHSTFTKIALLKNQASVALNPLVSLFGRLVARSGRKRGNRQTDSYLYVVLQ